MLPKPNVGCRTSRCQKTGPVVSGSSKKLRKLSVQKATADRWDENRLRSHQRANPVVIWSISLECFSGLAEASAALTRTRPGPYRSRYKHSTATHIIKCTGGL
ncbi:unnamed protein product [Protopolystoma xenopodis]|uniref:Uncharacterized protein n=1 Tax=Protopolystoma xenopodis TaxID=117903 RepID=A0A448WJL6_9PLAT|nr:unnamed protein product [Protopolystoma xenopodis]